MHSFFIWSDTGDGAFMGERLQREGHKVRMYLRMPQARDVYKGIIPHASVGNPRKDEVVLFDTVGFGDKADRLRASGYRTVGASDLADMMELDRSFGTSLMKGVGIKTPETHAFKGIKEGIKFLSTKPGFWFYKPYGNQDAGLTYGDEVDGLARFMEWSGTKYKPEGYELQRKVEGTEISLEGWFDGRKFVYPWNSTVEDKKLMVSDLGPRTGCMANVVWGYEDPRTPLAMRTVARLEVALEKAGHVGPVDLNMIVATDGEPYGLEWSPRFGYDAWPALTMLIKGDLGDQLEQFSRGRLDSWNVDCESLALTIAVSIPPYPHWEYAGMSKGLLLSPELRRDPSGVLLRDVMLDKYNRLAVSGMDCYVATMGATGTNIGLLRDEVLDMPGKFKIPNAQYRTDPVKRYESVVRSLSKLGYDTFSPGYRKEAHA